MKNEFSQEKSNVKKRCFNPEKMARGVIFVDKKLSIRNTGKILSLFIVVSLILFFIGNFNATSSRYLTKKNSVTLEIVAWNSPQSRTAVLHQAKKYLADHSSPTSEITVLNGLRNLSLNFTESELQPFYALSHFPEQWHNLTHKNSPESDASNKSKVDSLTIEDFSFTRQVLDELAQLSYETDTVDLLKAKEFLNQFDNSPVLCSDFRSDPASDSSTDLSVNRVFSLLRLSDCCWFAINYSLNQQESFYRNPLNRIAFYAPEEILTIYSRDLFSIKNISPLRIFSVFFLLVFSIPGMPSIDNLLFWFATLNLKIGTIRILKFLCIFFNNLSKYTFRTTRCFSSLIWTKFQRLLI